MAKLLETRLPNAIGEVSPDVYNRLVRVLELNLGTFDPSATPQHNLTTLAKNKFNVGDIIWNLNAKSLQVFDGSKWYDIYSGTTGGVSATGAVSSLSVSTNGAISIDL